MQEASRDERDNDPAAQASELRLPQNCDSGNCCGGHHDHADHGHRSRPSPAAGNATVRDPVCGMTVDPADQQASLRPSRRNLSFLLGRLPDQIRRRPEELSRQDRKPKAEAPEGAIYTCPMHPQIRQVGPGSCPICGMALEPEVASLDAPPNPELADMTRRFWIGLVLSLPAVVLEMGGHLVGGHGWVDPTLSNWIQLVFATPVVLWAGWPFFVRGWQSLLTRNLNMFTLIAMGTGVAYVYSVDRHRRARQSSRRRSAAMAARSRSISKPPPSLPCWCCSARCWSCAPARRHPARSRRCCNWRRRPRGASAMTAPTTRSRSTACRSATICGSGPARRCRSTASFSKAAPRSTNRW